MWVASRVVPLVEPPSIEYCKDGNRFALASHRSKIHCRSQIPLGFQGSAKVNAYPSVIFRRTLTMDRSARSRTPRSLDSRFSATFKLRNPSIRSHLTADVGLSPSPTLQHDQAYSRHVRCVVIDPGNPDRLMNNTHPDGPHVLPFARPRPSALPLYTVPVTRPPAAEQPTSVPFTPSTRSALEKRLVTELANLDRIEDRREPQPAAPDQSFGTLAAETPLR